MIIEPYHTLAHYHKWAYQLLFASIDHLSDAQYFADKQLAFGSIHQTLNHLYMGDHAWFCRFTDQAQPFKSVKEISFYDYECGKKMLLAQCEQWISFAEQLQTPLPDVIITNGFNGKKRETPYIATLSHVFNHATHHRGQISAALTQDGLPPPEMDLLYYLLSLQQ